MAKPATSKVDVFMQFFVGDYLADTMHLTTLQHGAYLLLIFAYWRNKGPLPDDDGELAAICRVSLSDWSAIRKTLARFFQIGDGAWRHKRIELELLKAIAQKRAKQKGAQMTNAKRWSLSDSLSVSLTVSDSGSDSESHCVSPSPSPSLANQIQIKEPPPLRGAPKGVRTPRKPFAVPSLDEIRNFCAERQLHTVDPETFRLHYESNGWKVGKNSMKDWKATVQKWHRDEITRPKPEYSNGAHRNGQSRPHKLEANAGRLRELQEQWLAHPESAGG